MNAESRARAVAAYCRRRNLPAPTLVRVASGTSLYRSADLVIRVAAPNRSAMSASRQIAASRLLADHGVRTVTSAGPLQVTDTGEDLTAWHYIDHAPDAPYAGRNLGAQIRALHDIPVHLADDTLGRLPRLLDAVDRGRRRIGVMELLGPEATGLPKGHLRGLFDQLEDTVTTATRTAPPTLLHGDLNPGNVLHSAQTGTHLIDLEALTVGPWPWDLVNTQLLIADGDIPASALTDTLRGYGRDLADEPAWPALCWFRALGVVTWMVLEARADGAVSAEKARRRLDWLAAGFPGLPPLR